MKNLIGLFKDLQKNRKLIWELAKADFKKRFVGSYFDIVWMFVQPVVTVFILPSFRWDLKVFLQCRERPMFFGLCQELYLGFTLLRQ